MGRKIAHKHIGTFYDHNGYLYDDYRSAIYYEDGKKWVLRDKWGHCRYLTSIYYWCSRDFSLRIPTHQKDRIVVRKELQAKIDHCIHFLEGNPISGSYRARLNTLREIQNKYFSNSIDFIMTEG